MEILEKKIKEAKKETEKMVKESKEVEKKIKEQIQEKIKASVLRIKGELTRRAHEGGDHAQGADQLPVGIRVLFEGH